jgi:uncharacterized protein YhbP (UPF0306 family)
MTENNKDLNFFIKDYLNQGKLLHLATSSENSLWLCHVWYALGQDISEIIFTSNKSRRHSQEIKNNPIVAGGVIAIELEGLGQKVRGLSFEGLAEEVANTQIEDAYVLYAKRWPQIQQMFTAQDILYNKVDMRMYKIKLTKVVLFDEVNFPKNPRQEVYF